MSDLFQTSGTSPTMQTESNWMTTQEAAAYLRIAPRTLLSWVRQGTIKGYVLSGTERVTWRFLRSDLDVKMQPPSVALTKWRIQ
jgi:excisionase family DNA binding protein